MPYFKQRYSCHKNENEFHFQVLLSSLLLFIKDIMSSPSAKSKTISYLGQNLS